MNKKSRLYGKSVTRVGKIRSSNLESEAKYHERMAKSEEKLRDWCNSTPGVKFSGDRGMVFELQIGDFVLKILHGLDHSFTSVRNPVATIDIDGIECVITPARSKISSRSDLQEIVEFVEKYDVKSESADDIARPSLGSVVAKRR